MTDKDKKFRQVYNDYYPLIYSVIYKRIRSIHDTEDMCHNIFSKMYEKMDEIIDFRKWLYGTVKYSIINFYESSRKTMPDISIEDSVNAEPVFVNGERDMRIIINEAIERDENFQDEKERILFELIAINNFTYNKAGKHLGMTKRQVEYSYFKILKRIMNYLKEKGISNIEELL